jgi:hypothetical protein
MFGGCHVLFLVVVVVVVVVMVMGAVRLMQLLALQRSVCGLDVLRIFKAK